MPIIGGVAANLGTLVAHLGLDTDELDLNAGKAIRKLGSVQGEMRKLINLSGKVAVSLGAAGAAMAVALVEKAGAAAREIQNLSNVANATTREFQRNAAAAKSVGIETDKLADIYKDMNDRVGEFLQTGSGPMLDFFTNVAPRVGITADAFRTLSGPQALQLYVTSLERANLSQQEMTFYLEAVASDSSRLIPLLRDGGKQMQELGDQAERLGRVLSDADLERLMAGKRAVDQFKDAIAAASMQTTAVMAPAIQAIAEGLNETLGEAFSSSEDDVVSWGDVVADVLAFSADAASGAFATIGAGFKSAGTTLGAGFAQAVALVTGHFKDAQQVGSEWFEDQKRIWSNLAEDTNLTRFRDKLEELRQRQRDIGQGLNRPAGAAAPAPARIPGLDINFGAMRLPGPGDIPDVGLLDLGPSQQELDAQLDRLRDFAKSEMELLQDQHDDRMKLLRQQLDEKNITEQEYRDLGAKLEEEYQDRIVELNERSASTIEGLLEGSFRNRLQAGTRFLVQMTAGTATENKKMFELNKVAAIAGAALDSKEAILGAYKVGAKIGGPVLGAAFAAAAGLATAEQIKAIHDQQFSGATAAPSLAGSTAAPPVSPVESGGGPTVFVSDFAEEDGLFTSKQVRRLMQRIAEEAGDGARIVVA